MLATSLSINPLAERVALWTLPPLKKFKGPGNTIYEGMILQSTSQLLTIAEFSDNKITKIHYVPLGQQSFSLELATTESKRPSIKPSRRGGTSFLVTALLFFVFLLSGRSTDTLTDKPPQSITKT